jgi:hypothetical protein
MSARDDPNRLMVMTPFGRTPHGNRVSSGEQYEHIANLIDRERSANVVVSDGILRHRSVRGFRRLLNERESARSNARAQDLVKRRDIHIDAAR